MTSTCSGLQGLSLYDPKNVARFRSHAGNDGSVGGEGQGLMAVIEKIDWRRKVG